MKPSRFFSLLPRLTLLLAFLCVIGLFVMVSLQRENAALREGTGNQPEPKEESPSPTPTSDPSEPFTARLGESADAGLDYLEKLYFLGESTTAHMASRGGIDRTHVWSGKDNTLTLSLMIDKTKIEVTDQNGETESMTVGEAVSRVKPEGIVLTLGVNGLVGFKDNEQTFKTAYRKLIRCIRESSPATVIILQSEFPVSSSCTTFSQMKPEAVNTAIDKLNGWAEEVAIETGCYYLDTSSVLKNAKGFLPDSFDNGDGLHLSASAYTEVMKYIRKHAVPSLAEK